MLHLRSPFFAGEAGNKGSNEEYKEDGGKEHDDADTGAFVQVTRSHKVGLNFTVNSHVMVLIVVETSVYMKCSYSWSVKLFLWVNKPVANARQRSS